MKRRRFLSIGKEWGFRSPFLQDGTWRVRKRHLVNGTVKCLTLKAKTRSSGKAEVLDLAFADRAPRPLEPKAATVGQVIDCWLGTVEVREVSKRDLENCARIFKAKLGGADRLLSAVTLQDLEALFFKGDWKDLSGQTKMKYRALLRRIWHYAVKHGYAVTNLPEQVEPPKAWRADIKRARKIGRALTHEEARALLAACRGPVVVAYERERFGKRERIAAELEAPEWLWLFVFISLRTGLRRSNVIGNRDKRGLLWGHLDMKAKVLHIPGEEMKNGEDLSLPIHEELADALQERLRSLGRIPDKSEPVIAGTAGVNLRKAFRLALRRAGLDETIRPHDLRHTFASWIGARCPEAITKCLLHHDGGDVTSRYTHAPGREVLRKALNGIPRLLGGGAAGMKRKGVGS